MMSSHSQILIIDDDRRNIFALTAVLESKNYRCISADSARRGFEILKATKNIDVVLMDMMMPDMDGYEAIAEMKKNNVFKNIPVIAVTAQAMTGDKEKCIQAGAFGYISKPINVYALLKLINNLI